MNNQLDKEGGLKKYLLVGGVWAFGTKVIGGLGGLIIAAILARLLSPGDLGVYFLALSIAFSSGMLTCVGLNLAVVRLISESISKENNNNDISVVVGSFLIVVATGLIFSTLFWLYLGIWIAQDVFHSKSFAEIVGLLSFWILAQGIQILIGEIYRGYQNIRFATLFSGSMFGGNISTILHLVTFTAFWMFGPQLSVNYAVGISLLINWVCVTIGLILLTLKIGKRFLECNTSLRIRYLISTSFPLWLSNISILSFGHADLWIIAAFLAEEKVALYGAVARLVKLFATSLIVVNEVIAPVIAHFNVRDEKDHLEWSLRTTSAIATAMVAPLLIPFVIFGAQILDFLFGQFYADGALILAILSIAQIFCVALGSGGYTLSMTGHGKSLMWISILTSSFAIIGSMLIVEKYGILGVSIVIAISLILQKTAMLIAARSLCGFWIHASPVLGYEALRSLYRELLRAVYEKKY